MPRVARKISRIRIAITIHIVRIVLLMLGWKPITTDPLANGWAASRSITVWGGGSSRVLVMKQVG